MEGSFVKSPEEVCAYFNVTPHQGLSESQVIEQRKKFGRNELPEEESTPLWQLILDQFQDQLVLILLGAAIISFVLAWFEEHEDAESATTAFVEPIVILLILIANATVGVLQESSAEKAIDALKEYSPDEAKVVRNGGVLSKIRAEELVPGDVIDISVGDKIPADARVYSIGTSVFRVDQALLTGESVSVNKDVDAIDDKAAVKQDQINMVFSGTTCVLGKARAIVVATGTSTAIGDIHTSITSQISEKTPLKRKLDDFGDTLAKVITVICILVWLVNIRHFNDPSHNSWMHGAVYYFKIAVALAVAAIPEGLAAVITACLALGTKKMAKRGAIVRSLPSVETLGCTSVICSDKTGTLTTNQMSVARVLSVGTTHGQVDELIISGTSYEPIGDVTLPDGSIVTSLPAKNKVIRDIARICSLCNDARIAYDETNDSYNNIGEPTEAALQVLVEKLGTDNDVYNNSLLSLSKNKRTTACNDYFTQQNERHATLEFTRDRKSMSVIVSSGHDTSLLVKGAPESILERCTYVATHDTAAPVPLTADIREALNAKISEYGQGLALRCIGLAKVENVTPGQFDLREQSKFATYEQEMTFVGLVAMMDPPRPEVKNSIEKCKTAGIRVIVITGDNKNTAEAICRDIGVFDRDEDLTGKSFTGREFDVLSKEDKIKAVQQASLFSRTEPAHKQELVDLLQSLGEIVAMTGDGVNDAPALKRADIGVAMGSGTDVAKLAADMVLADDNFATIEKAVEEGRSIYNNTKQFIRYLISSNIGEVVSIFLTVLLGLPEALIPVQLLWVNLVTDGLPATCLAMNPPDHDIMRRPPRNGRETLVDGWLFFRYMAIGVYVGVATVFGYVWWFMFYQGGPQITYYQLSHFHQCSELFPEIGCQMFTNTMSMKATTISLSILVVIEMLNAMNSLSENESLLTLPLWTNPYLVLSIILSMALHFMILYVPFFTKLFAIVPLNMDEWKGVLYISLPVIVLDEILKFITRTWIQPPAIVTKQKSKKE
ncbi:SERCA-type calcium-translocating P-type ATPase [Halteromyces radiatus]|uniref:SERCA-type calcium-translocating P-type ATPase n=1 Tax=Halteromyces radiatus TaxID=101107 RepID=UPI00221FACC4|nr:SERCA-type calcium-translocating P-type ATPase [Halteromyces radiatus]KAI8099074.1 SERCA-type calcium-translocating P-type ATPase [Halteromyces radiatus]